MDKEKKERLITEENGAVGESGTGPCSPEPPGGPAADRPAPAGEEDWLCQREELISLVQRKQADLDNFRRISRKKEEEIRNYGLFDFLKRLLAVVDNLDLALATAREDEAVPESHLEGLAMIRKQLLQLLEQEGVEPVEALGEVFDPHFHEAVLQIPGGRGEPGSVVEEIQKGYLYKERVLRPSRVAVKQQK
ncbi:MAG: nucleotide exchange factor GrpE [Firmicutes bacterium]|jgi:molecular chaperone GrpE|nr:nucleotide exchange factor GrpE [Bacillota bacterium]